MTILKSNKENTLNKRTEFSLNAAVRTGLALETLSALARARNVRNLNNLNHIIASPHKS